MYFNYTKCIPIVFQLQNTNYFCQGHKIQNMPTLNVFKIHVFQLLVFQLLQHCLSHAMCSANCITKLFAAHCNELEHEKLFRKLMVHIGYNFIHNCICN